MGSMEKKLSATRSRDRLLMDLRIMRGKYILLQPTELAAAKSIEGVQVWSDNNGPQLIWKAMLP